MKIDGKALSYGILAGLGILAFYISVLSIFQSYGFALNEFKRLWVWLVPLSIGFGTQIGLYTSIKYDATIKAGATTCGTISGGSMVACCSHYLLNIIPLIGGAGLMEIDGRVIIYGILIAIILLLLLTSFGIINLNFGKATGNAASGEYG